LPKTAEGEALRKKKGCYSRAEFWKCSHKKETTTKRLRLKAKEDVTRLIPREVEVSKRRCLSNEKRKAYYIKGESDS